jgi:hypothetical protein
MPAIQAGRFAVGAGHARDPGSAVYCRSGPTLSNLTDFNWRPPYSNDPAIQIDGLHTLFVEQAFHLIHHRVHLVDDRLIRFRCREINTGFDQ